MLYLGVAWLGGQKPVVAWSRKPTPHTPGASHTPGGLKFLTNCEACALSDFSLFWEP